LYMKVTDLSKLSQEGLLQVLYNNSKWNRRRCFEKEDEEGMMFWSGTINGIYGTVENLGLEFDWLEGRDKDFNQFYKSIKK